MPATLTQSPASRSPWLAPFQFLLSGFKRRRQRSARANSNHEYAQGYWERLKDPVEYAQLAATAYLLQRHARGGSVLEIGCGEALLMQHLHPDDYASWLGVDISQVAIGRAQEYSSSRVRYVVGDMNDMDLVENFDAIVFSESIYYAADPAELLRRYARHLNAGGRFVISIYDRKNRDFIWRKIHDVAQAIDSSLTRNEYGTWVCEVLQMR